MPLTHLCSSQAQPGPHPRTCSSWPLAFVVQSALVSAGQAEAWTPRVTCILQQEVWRRTCLLAPTLADAEWVLCSNCAAARVRKQPCLPSPAAVVVVKAPGHNGVVALSRGWVVLAHSSAGTRQAAANHRAQDGRAGVVGGEAQGAIHKACSRHT